MSSYFSVTLFYHLLLIFSTVAGKPYGDDNNDLYSNDEYEDHPESGEKKEKVILKAPIFVSESSNVMINEGGTMSLPCIVDRLEGFVLLWKKGEDIIAVGKQLINKDDKRVLLLKDEKNNGNNLVISNARDSDGGTYTCQVSSYDPTEIIHSVTIRVKPEIRSIPHNGKQIVSSGSSVTLSCEILKGHPTPEVKWRRKERKMPSGEDYVRGLSITFPSVTRHHSGHYICEADNGFGESSSNTVELDVHHAPEVEQEETFIHTGAGDETEVTCIVHSSPRSSVNWTKDNVSVIESEGFVVSQLGNRHTLLISQIDESKFGRYACVAENELGRDSKSTEVSGRAGKAVITSNPKGSLGEAFKLEWSAASLTPISVFRLQYKGIDEENDGWKEIEVPATFPATSSKNKLYAGTHTLSALKPAAVYVARISSKNHYGYNDFGASFKFATRGGDPIQKPMRSSASELRTTTAFVDSPYFFAFIFSLLLL